jgi:hypothetical protein
MKTFGYVKVAAIGATAADVGLREKSDCTVRALANAKGIDYLTAHATAKQHGRVSGKGVHFNVLHSMYTAMGFELLNIFGTTRPAGWARWFTGTKTIEKGITLKRLLPKLTKGRYIVNITGHALAVVDGKVIDTNHNRESVSVIAVFKLKEEN